MIKNIIFDIGQVLVKVDWMNFVYGRYPKDIADKITDAFWLRGYWDELDQSIIPVSDVLSHMQSAYPELKEEISYIFNHIGDCISMAPYTIELILGLKKDYKVYYLSNYADYTINKNLHALAFTSLMDGGIFSGHVHLIKPDPRIFNLLCEQYHFNKEESVFIDDNAKNIASAASLGFKTIHFKDYDSMMVELNQIIKDNK